MGYVLYRNDYIRGLPDYTPEEMRAIISHRNSILEKYRIQGGISNDELYWVCRNIKSLPREQAVQMMERLRKCMMNSTIGATYSNNFFALTTYEKVFVDVRDVFAVCYCSDNRMKLVTNDEVILCAVFTNDPYIPVFPVVYIGKKGFFELTKSKMGRQAVQEHFTTLCPNLTYPVCDVKDLKRMVKSETIIRGNIEKNLLLEKLFDVSVGAGLFDTNNMICDVSSKTYEMLHNAGYITQNEVESML